MLVREERRFRSPSKPPAAGTRAAENLSPSSSLRSLHRRLPTAAPRPCFCSAGRQSHPSHTPPVSELSRTLSCRPDKKNCSGAWLPPHLESLLPRILDARPAGVNQHPFECRRTESRQSESTFAARSRFRNRPLTASSILIAGICHELTKQNASPQLPSSLVLQGSLAVAGNRALLPVPAGLETAPKSGSWDRVGGCPAYRAIATVLSPGCKVPQ